MSYVCSDGPWHRQHLWLRGMNTLVLTVGHWRGRYVLTDSRYLEWEEQ